MKIKSSYTLALLMATSTLLVTSTSLRASDLDDRIESSAKKSHVFKTYLKDDSIKTESENGVVTLTSRSRKHPINHWPKIRSRVCPASSAWTIS